MSFASCTSSMEEPDPLFKIRNDCEDVATSTSLTRRSRGTLTQRKWRAAFDAQGKLTITKVLRYIERGGVMQSIRAEVWEFLLGTYSPSSSAAERKLLRESRRDKYSKLKEECMKMDPAVGSGEVIITPRVNSDGSSIADGELMNGASTNVSATNGNLTMDSPPTPTQKKVIQWKSVLHQIGLDVVRTDRVLYFYEDPKNLARLWDILAVYAWIDEEVGYCQGMSDLCSPMVLLFPDEADAFWCFKFLMQRVRENFRCTNKMMGVQNQLTFLASAMHVIDPKLHAYLDALGGSTYIFAFRMLMVLFRREFSFIDTLRLWEMMWALEYHPNLDILTAEDVARLVNSNPDYRAGGRFAKRNIKYGAANSLNENPSVAVFFVASILVMLRSKLMKRSQGLDEVVKALNDMTGKIDANQSCRKALKLHKVYLRKMKQQQQQQRLLEQN